MRRIWTVLSSVTAALGLALVLPVSSSAGTITIVDGTNDTISFLTDSPGTAGRLNTANCSGSESPSVCGFVIVGPAGAVTGGDTFDHQIISLLEPAQTLIASDNLRNTDVGAGGNNAWQFISDLEGGLTVLTNAFTLTENGSPQLVATISYKNVDQAIFATDQIFIQSDLDAAPPPGVPEPASASLLLLGGGILVAAGRLRKRVRG